MQIKTCRIYDQVPVGEIKHVIAVGRNPRHVLSPTWEILKAFQDEEIDWEEYVRLYIALLVERMKTRRSEFDALLVQARTGTIHLACFCGMESNCHRNEAKAFLEQIS